MRSAFGIACVVLASACTSVDAPPHTVCDGDRASCACVAGYEMDEAGACVWSGVVANPAFDLLTGWELDGAQIDPTLANQGTIDRGVVVWSGDALCRSARISQTLIMPKYSLAEPLVIELSAPTEVAFAVGTTWHDHLTGWDLVDVHASPPILRVCLGDAAFAPESTEGLGAEVALVLGPGPTVTSCSGPDDQFVVDHVEIKPAEPGECPAPGKVNNGDFEHDGGWDLWLDSSPVGTAAIEAGVGQGKSRGGRFVVHRACSTAGARDLISVPGDMASPVVSFFVRSSPSTTAEVHFEQGPPRPVNVFTTGSTNKLCLPQAMRGGVFRFDLRFPSFPGAPSSDCFNALEGEAIVDDLKLFDDPTCR